METNKYNVAAKKHQVPTTTVYRWIKRDKNKSKTQKVKGQKALGKELADAKLEIKGKTIMGAQYQATQLIQM